MWGFISGLGGKLLAALAVAGAALAIFFKIRQSGKDALRREQQDEVAKIQQKDKKLEQELNRDSYDDLVDKL